MMKDGEDLMSCLSWVSCRYVITIYDIMKFFAERSKSWRVNLNQNSWVHITLVTKIKKRICSIFKLRAGASKTSHVCPVPGKFRQIVSLAQFQPYSKLIIDFREGFKKKSWNFPIGGGGGPKIKKNPTFPKTVPFYLECHDSARNVIKFFWPYVPPPPSPQPPPILLLPYIDPYVHGSLPIYSNCNIHHDLK